MQLIKRFPFTLLVVLGAIAVALSCQSTTYAKQSAAGNGGRSTANADGGALHSDDINTGGQTGGTYYGVPDENGNVVIEPLPISNNSELTFGTGGGTAISDASGNDHNGAAG